VDVPWKYLNFFMEDDAKLADIGREYGAGRMLTGACACACASHWRRVLRARVVASPVPDACKARATPNNRSRRRGQGGARYAADGHRGAAPAGARAGH
jgi:hypothetical protein